MRNLERVVQLPHQRLHERGFTTSYTVFGHFCLLGLLVVYLYSETQSTAQYLYYSHLILRYFEARVYIRENLVQSSYVTERKKLITREA